MPDADVRGLVRRAYTHHAALPRTGDTCRHYGGLVPVTTLRTPACTVTHVPLRWTRFGYLATFCSVAPNDACTYHARYTRLLCLAHIHHPYTWRCRPHYNIHMPLPLPCRLHTLWMRFMGSLPSCYTGCPCRVIRVLPHTPSTITHAALPLVHLYLLLFLGSLHTHTTRVPHTPAHALCRYMDTLLPCLTHGSGPRYTVYRR